MPEINHSSPAGTALGREMARLFGTELGERPDHRCQTCAFRPGDHLANNSAGTLMDAVKCLVEREPFWCHEHDRPCAGWVLMRFPVDRAGVCPWPFVGMGGYRKPNVVDTPDVIALPDLSGTIHL